ncbi:MAG: rod shape-determining protein MreD [Planctomycetes bacterium RBG_16_55_9]|nr:MAG: rod shape-determining protein MreD [Planctomycetes bacterium RBG_16_55_9]
MRWLRFAILILAVTILQKGVLARWDHRPDLLLVLLVFFAVYSSTSEAIISSFTLGFAADLIGSPLPMGPHMISFGLFGTLLAYVHRVVAIRRMPYQAMAILAVGILTGVLTHLLAYLFKREPMPENVFTAVLLTSVYSSLVGPFLFHPAALCVGIEMGRFRRRSRR